MVKSPREILIETLEQDILKSEQKIRDLCDEAVTTSQGPTIFFNNGFE